MNDKKTSITELKESDIKSEFLNKDIKRIRFVTPTEHIYREDGEGTALDFTGIFRRSVEDSILTHRTKKVIFGIETDKVELMYELINRKEIMLFYHFAVGIFPNNDLKEEFKSLLMKIWGESNTFKEVALAVDKALEKEGSKEIENKAKLFKNFNNPVKINMLNNYYRFSILERFTPIKNYILNDIGKKVYRTNNPLVKFIEDTNIKDREILLEDSIYLTYKKVGNLNRIKIKNIWEV